MDDDAPAGLRERRRLDTQLDIHEAALSLFEEQGDGTWREQTTFALG